MFKLSSVSSINIVELQNSIWINIYQSFNTARIFIEWSNKHIIMRITLKKLERIQFAANVNQGGSFPWTLKMIFPSFLLWEISGEIWFCHQCHLHYKSFLLLFEKNKFKVRRKGVRLLTELCFFHIICILRGPFSALWRYQPITEKTSKSRMFL